MHRLLRIVEALGHVARRRDLIARGFKGSTLTAAVRLGVLRRVRNGYYADEHATAAQVAAVRIGGRIGCLDALASYGFWGGSDPVTHVAIPVNASRLRVRRDGETVRPDRSAVAVRLHWCDLPTGSHDRSAWRVGLIEALSEVARCASRPDVRAAFESVVHGGGMPLEEAQTLLDTSVADGFRRMRVSHLSESGAESHLVEILEQLGLTYQQQVVLDSWRVDVVVGRAQTLLAIEVDGRRYHEGDVAFERDRAKDAALLAHGIATLRLPAKLVIESPLEAARRITAALDGLAGLG